ncbi:hypothetical protein RRG08_058066 [Elysia crispata]|uniref:Uncharacterized protein n=1 Tax=Elysia crispata TaxID=231223 RepID=A0AAE1AD37_9GAST|nr:hypothetical protein RRG08_058066 [Elysia crispata]
MKRGITRRKGNNQGGWASAVDRDILEYSKVLTTSAEGISGQGQPSLRRQIKYRRKDIHKTFKALKPPEIYPQKAHLEDCPQSTETFLPPLTLPESPDIASPFTNVPTAPPRIDNSVLGAHVHWSYLTYTTSSIAGNSLPLSSMGNPWSQASYTMIRIESHRLIGEFHKPSPQPTTSGDLGAPVSVMTVASHAKSPASARGGLKLGRRLSAHPANEPGKMARVPNRSSKEEAKPLKAPGLTMIIHYHPSPGSEIKCAISGISQQPGNDYSRVHRLRTRSKPAVSSLLTAQSSRPGRAQLLPSAINSYTWDCLAPRFPSLSIPEESSTGRVASKSSQEWMEIRRLT